MGLQSMLDDLPFPLLMGARCRVCVRTDFGRYRWGEGVVVGLGRRDREGSRVEVVCGHHDVLGRRVVIHNREVGEYDYRDRLLVVHPCGYSFVGYHLADVSDFHLGVADDRHLVVYLFLVNSSDYAHGTNLALMMIVDDSLYLYRPSTPTLASETDRNHVRVGGDHACSVSCPPFLRDV